MTLTHPYVVEALLLLSGFLIGYGIGKAVDFSQGREP